MNAGFYINSTGLHFEDTVHIAKFHLVRPLPPADEITPEWIDRVVTELGVRMEKVVEQIHTYTDIEDREEEMEHYAALAVEQKLWLKLKHKLNKEEADRRKVTG